MFRWEVRLRGPGTAYQTAVTVRHYVYSFGTVRARTKIVVHVFNTLSLRWVKLAPVRHWDFLWGAPIMRKYHTAVLIEDISSIYLWGGYSQGLMSDYCNVLYAFDVNTHRWFKPKVSGTVPEARQKHSACALGKVMYIHGGRTKTGYTGDLHKLDAATMVWSLINTTGRPSSRHTATIIGTKMFVFGGWFGGSGHWRFIRVFDTETNCWLNTPYVEPCPSGRRGHSAFLYNGELYIFDGRRCRDCWKYSPETFSWKKVEPKGEGPCSITMMMCCCLVGDRVILFGGHRTPDELDVLDLNPSLKTLCKLVVIQYGLELSEELPHNIRWELAAMPTNSNCINKDNDECCSIMTYCW